MTLFFSITKIQMGWSREDMRWRERVLEVLQWLSNRRRLTICHLVDLRLWSRYVLWEVARLSENFEQRKIIFCYLFKFWRSFRFFNFFFGSAENVRRVFAISSAVDFRFVSVPVAEDAGARAAWRLDHLRGWSDDRVHVVHLAVHSWKNWRLWILLLDIFELRN